MKLQMFLFSKNPQNYFLTCKNPNYDPGEWNMRKILAARLT